MPGQAFHFSELLQPVLQELAPSGEWIVGPKRSPRPASVMQRRSLPSIIPLLRKGPPNSWRRLRL